VSKTSLYRLFESKDALIAAFAAEQDRLFWARWDRVKEQHADDPRASLKALLSGIVERIGRPAFRGCPFFNLAMEFPDQNHPGRIIARDNKKEMRARLADIVAKLGATDPNRVASQIALIINGQAVRQPSDTIKTCPRFAHAVFEHATVLKIGLVFAWRTRPEFNRVN
jgi:AcrR family transcriptional regulator